MTKFFINNLIYALKSIVCVIICYYVRTEKESLKEPKGNPKEPQRNPKDAQMTTK